MSRRERRDRVNLSASWLRSILLSTAMLDELTFGFLVVGLPLARDTFSMSYEQVGLLFTAGALAALIIEPAVNLVSDHISKRVPILTGMFSLVLAFAVAGLTRNYVVLLLAVAVANPAIGAAVGLAQAALVEQRPDTATRTLTRWTLLSSVGDLLSPLVVAVTGAAGGGWMALSLLGAGLWLVAGGVTLPFPFPRPAAATKRDEGKEEEDEGQPGRSALARLRRTLTSALRDRILLRWLVVLFMATMVDEIFLGFTGLLLRDRLHASITTISLILALGMIGGMAGLLTLERLLARRPESQQPGIRLLPWLALLTLAGVAALLLAQNLWLAALALVAIGFGATGWYPVAKAAAYSRLPGRPGMLLAITGLLTPLELVLPVVVGGLADRFGLVLALGFLGLAPLGVLVFAPRISAKSDNLASVSRET